MKGNEKRAPVRKVRVGRISISLWRRLIERKSGQFQQERICVQHSRCDMNTKEWKNQQIWLNVDELRDLANALDDFRGVTPEVEAEKVSDTEQEEGEKSPSSSAQLQSIRVNRIVEYIKVNSEFDYQSHMGTSTGKLKSRKFVRDAIDQFYEDQNKGPNQKQTFLVNSTEGLNTLSQQLKESQEANG